MLLLGLELANLILLSLFFSYHSSRKKMLGELVLTMSLKNEILVMMRCLVKWWAELNLSPEESLKRAPVVERYDRPMPKLRNTKPDSGRYEERPGSPGTLNVAQLRQIMLLYQGKADDHEGPMNAQQVAEKF
ncbi:hypothetical protein POPTR_010G024000v4 [Populus trichocarpa]|uniref:Uncharacterized protein n=1 Tax=Populus trichocarpa TaxID=3694 RepID=A0ACC0SAQ9_POPTR|nr:hypothetical protein BDE02_10G020800 [Populus trichocarpa]KAI9386438.1 hypothetical protein POPTR_010G024000v4 [Populus trichocarpa]